MNRGCRIANSYRKEIFKSIIEYAKNNIQINNIIIGGDLNQDIASKEVQEFYSNLRVKDIHQSFNYIILNNLDYTHRWEIKYIDSITVTLVILEYAEGSKLYKRCDIIDTDHRSHIIDINLESYYKDEFSEWNNINKEFLRVSRRAT